MRSHGAVNPNNEKNMAAKRNGKATFKGCVAKNCDKAGIRVAKKTTARKTKTTKSAPRIAKVDPKRSASAKRAWKARKAASAKG